MERQNHSQFEAGQRILVSNGQTRPPQRFNRELASWKRSNYLGHIKKVEGPRDYQPFGSLILKRDDYPDGMGGCIEFEFHIPLGCHLNVKVLAA